MINLYVCKICGEPYLGGSVPDECPFCGAPKNYMGLAEEYSKIWDVEMTEQEREDMKKTLELEINAVAYYDKVSKREEKYSKYNRLYKQLKRVETEHAEVAAHFLGIELPEFVGEDLRENMQADLARTKELEAGAVENYKVFMANATNEKVKQFYHALLHAEQGHFDFIAGEVG